MQVTLQKGGWHYRLQLFTLGKVPFEENFCPYFWITVSCLFVIPFTGSWYLTKKFAKGSYRLLAPILGPLFLKAWEIMARTLDGAANIVNDVVCEPLVDWTIKHMPEERVFDLYEKEQDWHRRHKMKPQEVAKLEKWKDLNKETYKATFERLKEEKEKAYREKWARNAEAERRQRERKAQMKVFYGKVIYVTKIAALVLVSIVAALLLGAVAWLLYLLGTLLASISAAQYMVAAKWTGIVLAWIVGAVIVVGVLFVLGKKLKTCAKYLTLPAINLPRWKSKRREPSKFAKALCKVGDGIGSFFTFFVVFFENFKKDHCPSIEWKD